MMLDDRNKSIKMIDVEESGESDKTANVRMT